jgi:hypothetical protein
MKFIKIMLIILLFTSIYGCTMVTTSTFDLNLKKGIDTININESWNDPGIEILINEKEVMMEYATIYNDIDITKVGTYTVVYQVTYRNETKSITRKITVIDLIPPVITLNPGIDTVYKNSEWIDAFVTVTDNSGLEVTITTHGTVNTNMLGEYMIIYRAIDFFGNESSIVRYVHVIPIPSLS